jgi:hypothetical protein
VDIQQKTTSRVLYYQGQYSHHHRRALLRTFRAGEGYDLRGDRTPRHSAGTLPEEWNVPQAEVRLRLENHHMFLTPPTGTELQFLIVKRIAAAPAQRISEPPSPK